MPRRRKTTSIPTASPIVSAPSTAGSTAAALGASVAALTAKLEHLERLSATLSEELAQKESQLADSESRLAQSERALAEERRQVAELKMKLDILCKKLFGRKSEKVSPDQLAFAYEQLEHDPSLGAEGEAPEPDSGETMVKAHKRRNGHGRQAIPDTLPRVRQVRDVPEEQKWCVSCGVAKACIGEEIATKLDIVPAVVQAVEIVRPKYACPCCKKGVVIASSPLQAVEKGLATEGLLAHVAVSKFADHLPLHRQGTIFARHGIHLSRSTLSDWIEQVAEAVEPIYESIRRNLLRSHYLHTDDTPVTVILENKKSRKARIWVYVDPKGDVVYDFSLTHEKENPGTFLKDFTGRLQADAYSGYDHIFRSGKVVEIACWAHARRGIHEALDTDRARASALVGLIAKLFAIEADLKTEAEKNKQPIDEQRRRLVRQERSRPILDLIREKADLYEREVLPKSPLGEGLRYIRNQWTALTRFVDDGEVEIHNNPAENALRAVAVGRKNWLFAGSQGGGRRAAILYTLIASCRVHGVDPFAYLKDVLLRVASHPVAKIEALTPAGWKAAACKASEPESIAAAAFVAN